MKKKDDKKKTKNKGGRPTLFKAEYIEQVYKLALLGAIDEDIADFFNITETTLNNWKLNKKGFIESIKKGKMIADGNVADKLYNRAIGYTHKETKVFAHEGKVTDAIDIDKHYPPETAAAIFWLKNRQSKKWRDKQEIDYTEQKIIIPDEIKDDN